MFLFKVVSNSGTTRMKIHYKREVVFSTNHLTFVVRNFPV